MRLKNVLLAVNDMDRAIRFYKEIFGLQVILNQDGNVIMSEGLVLQDAKIWQHFLNKELIPKNNMSELYFEETDIEGLAATRRGIPQCLLPRITRCVDEIEDAALQNADAIQLRRDVLP